MSARPNQPIKVFISYSRKDEQQCEELIRHLAAMRKEGVIEVWHDPKIVPGAEWDATIKRELDAAQLILFLVSSRFVESKYCCEVEVPRAMQRHEARAAKVVPIMLESVTLGKECPFTHLQMLPSKGKPISSWPSPSEAFVDIVKGLCTTVDELLQPSADDLWYEQFRMAACDSLQKLLRPDKHESLRRELCEELGKRDFDKTDVAPLCNMLCDRTIDPKLAEKLLKFHKRLSDQRLPGADTVATIVDTILPLHFDVAVLRQAYRQRKNDGKSLLVNLVVTDFGAEMLMAALANRRAELCSLPPRKHPNPQKKRIGSKHQREYECPAPGRLPTGDPFQQELHDTMHDMAHPFLHEAERELLDRTNESELASRIAVFEEALKREFDALEFESERTPFWVYMSRSKETDEDRSRRERIFEEIARRVEKIAFVELYVAENAGKQEFWLERLLRFRFQDTKES